MSIDRSRTTPVKNSRRAGRVWLPTLRALVVCAASIAALPVSAAQDSKPYDDRLYRLSEILGAVHYLRELCGAEEGQQWRERMAELLQAEGSSALRKAKLTRSFNKGYQSYSRTYNTCSPSAQSAINRFLAEGAQIADGLVKSVP
jgi:uncharacterized protein (TIGR02301 family)